VSPLLHATTILQPTPAHFTPIHAEFMRVVLLSRCYTAAQPVLDQELLQVDKDRTGCSPRDLLLYHYYAGMVLCGLKQFNRATQVTQGPF
jgi:COP9 signalosome complex subunit 3